jgi:nitrate/TMAO reductase-like tetraheme cytochrome c subunit
MSKLCSFPDCKKQPTFNYEGESTGIYCAEHKKNEMVDVKNPSCKDCKKRPSFNYEGETKAIYCAEHKKNNMIDIRKTTCIDCKKGPCYNYIIGNVNLKV